MKVNVIRARGSIYLQQRSTSLDLLSGPGRIQLALLVGGKDPGGKGLGMISITGVHIMFVNQQSHELANQSAVRALNAKGMRRVTSHFQLSSVLFGCTGVEEIGG